MKAIPGVNLVEMARNRGNVLWSRWWLNVDGETTGSRINVARTEQACCTAIHYRYRMSVLLTMISDGTKAKEVEESSNSRCNRDFRTLSDWTEESNLFVGMHTTLERGAMIAPLLNNRDTERALSVKNEMGKET